jgi:EAL domain-containing protein (putative c-di-GMP-specific phosphodiesterase class I)
MLEHDKVSGVFGQVKIASEFLPLRVCQKPAEVVAHIARIKVSTLETLPLSSTEVDNLLVHGDARASEFETIINFDRLCRSVHMLNYLPLAHLQGSLFLDVDPRHILGVKTDHGAYFEEIIHKCGLETNRVVITLAFNQQYSRFYYQLIKGLTNYRQRGYRIALKLFHFAQRDQVTELVEKLVPDFLCLSAKDLENIIDNKLLLDLHHLKSLIASTGGRCILQHIENQKSVALARRIGFDWVEGSFYEISSPGESRQKEDYPVVVKFFRTQK